MLRQLERLKIKKALLNHWLVYMPSFSRMCTINGQVRTLKLVFIRLAGDWAGLDREDEVTSGLTPAADGQAAPPSPTAGEYAMLCYAMLCYAMLCYAMLCYAMLCTKDREVGVHDWLDDGK